AGDHAHPAAETPQFTWRRPGRPLVEGDVVVGAVLPEQHGAHVADDAAGTQVAQLRRVEVAGGVHVRGQRPGQGTDAEESDVRPLLDGQHTLDRTLAPHRGLRLRVVEERRYREVVHARVIRLRGGGHD